MHTLSSAQRRPGSGFLGLWVFAHLIVAGALAMLSLLATIIGGGLSLGADFLLALLQPALILPPLSLLQWIILQHWRPIPGRVWVAAASLGGLLGAGLALSAHVVHMDSIVWSHDWAGWMAAGGWAGMGLAQSAILRRVGPMRWRWLAASALTASLIWLAAPLLLPLGRQSFALPILVGWVAASAVWALLTGAAWLLTSES
jgi:hypothetical protein